MNTQRLEELIEAHLDHRLTPSDKQELETLLASSAEARRFFWEQAAWHGQIHAAARIKWSRDAQTAPGPGWFQRARVFIGNHRQACWTGLAAAAAILLVIWLTGPLAKITPAPVAVERPQPKGPGFWLASGSATIERAGQRTTAILQQPLQPGDLLVIDPGTQASLAMEDGTEIQLDPGSHLRMDDSNTRHLALMAGHLTARVHKQTPGHELVFNTPLARMLVRGTTFELSADPRATRLEVDEGLVQMNHAAQESEVQVAGGEFALALPGTEILAGLQPAATPPVRTDNPGPRDASLHPFNAESPWNTAIGSAAQFTDVVSPHLDLLNHGAVVLPAAHDRALVLTRDTDPETRVLQRYDGRELARIHAPADALRSVTRLAPYTIVDTSTDVAHELALADRQGGDLAAMLCYAIDLHGAGIPPAQSGHTFSGMPLVAGLIRRGEFEHGIPHVLAASILHAGLSRDSEGQAHTWPSRHMPLESKLLAAMGSDGNIRYGTLLAIPPEVDIASLGVGSSGPAFELARAMQDYGIYITHSYRGVSPSGQGNWKQPHLQLFAEVDDPETLRPLAAAVSKLVPCLKVVINNTVTTPGGGGTPRRPPPPNLATEETP